jgi:hypothetical protein
MPQELNQSVTQKKASIWPFFVKKIDNTRWYWFVMWVTKQGAGIEPDLHWEVKVTDRLEAITMVLVCDVGHKTGSGN